MGVSEIQVVKYKRKNRQHFNEARLKKLRKDSGKRKRLEQEETFYRWQTIGHNIQLPIIKDSMPSIEQRACAGYDPTYYFRIDQRVEKSDEKQKGDRNCARHRKNIACGLEQPD